MGASGANHGRLWISWLGLLQVWMSTSLSMPQGFRVFFLRHEQAKEALYAFLCA